VLGRVTVVEIAAGGEMIDSVRAGLRALPAAVDGVLLFPVDYAMVGASTVALLLVHLLTDEGDPEVVLPLFRERPGHPFVVRATLADEILDPSASTLRDVIRRPGRRVCTVATVDGWVSRDLDTPADLQAARGFAAWSGLSPVSQMIEHRSRRAYHPDPIDDSQLERWVQAARCASTSSMLQAYAVVAVRDPAKKARIAALCADQRHIHEAPLFLAICADLHKLALACERHGKQLDPGSLEIFLEATIDAALLAQNLLLAAESEGLGGCMLGAARKPSRYRRSRSAGSVPTIAQSVAATAGCRRRRFRSDADARPWH
jgi:nitroreductase